MRVITRNMKRATAKNNAWDIIRELNPDIALLQEVSSIPQDILDSFDTNFAYVTGGKNHSLLKFGTALLVKGKILKRFKLVSTYDWINKEIKKYDGNLSCYTIKPNNSCEINILPVYSPARPIDTSDIPEKDINTIKLQENNRIWLTEIIWSGLTNIDTKATPWIIAGDYNSSETFDKKWQKENGVTASFSVSGNKEILDRMVNLGFTECLRSYNGKIIPTFKHSRGKVIHQIDHIFVNKQLSTLLKNCNVGDETHIFGQKISDHLPIIADFENTNVLIPNNIEDFIKNNTWIFAKTYAQTAPHEYLVKRNLSPEDQKTLVDFAEFIKKNGYKKLFRDMEFTYFDIGDYMYRTMDDDIEKTDLINRALKQVI